MLKLSNNFREEIEKKERERNKSLLINKKKEDQDLFIKQYQNAIKTET